MNFARRLAFLTLSAWCVTEMSTTKVTYEWFANLTAGALLPTEHLSQYLVVAQLAVHIVDKNYVFQIEEIKLSDGDYIDKEPLFKPFKASYVEGDIKFYGDPNDQVWSLNMKRSLATLFQLKNNIYEEGAFSVKENNTYGTCDVEYIAVKSNSLTRITKLMDETQCSNSPQKRRSNIPFFVCPSSFQEAVSDQNEKEYVLMDRHKPYISEIISVGTSHFQPFQALAEAYYIHVRQLLRITSIQNEIEPVALNTSLHSQNITYSSTLAPDPSSEHFSSNKTSLKDEVYELLEKLTDSLDWKLSTKNLDNQTSFRILELMWVLDAKDWEDLYQKVSLGTSYTQETIQHFFWEFVPQVGSEASVIFIKNLVTSGKVRGFSASLLLITFPLYIKEMSERVLIESEELLRLTDADTGVKNSGVLSFAVLVQKVCSSHCSKEHLDRYTKHFLDKFAEAPNYQERMVYLQGLNNMQLSRTIEFLCPIITNPSYGRHIRYLAIWSTLLLFEKEPGKAGEIFWPIFLNTSESLEIRISAMTVLIKAQPSAARLLTFFWHMQTEPNHQLYNFFYTSVQSYANTKYPCYYKLRHVASQLSRYLLPRASSWASANYLLDYEDSVHGYGGLIHVFGIASESTGLPCNLYLSTEQHSHGLSSKYSVNVKLEGVVDPVWKMLIAANLTSFIRGMNITAFLERNRLKVRIPEVVHVELIFKIDENTVYCHYMDQLSFKEILSTIEQARALYYEFSVNYQRLRFPLKYEATKISDLGTPVALQIRTSSLLSLRGSIKQENKGVVRNADLDFRYSMNTVTSLRTLNFLNRKWYGAERIRSVHFRIPFTTNLQKHDLKSTFKITIDRQHEGSDNGSMYGFVWHSIITLLPTNRRKESTANNGNSHQWFVESRDFGARFNAEVFDCQGEKNILDTLHIIREAFQLSNKNYRMVTGGVPILGLYSLANYFTFIPPGDSCGLIISMTPLQVQLALVREGWTFHMTMENEKELHQIWDLITYYKDNEGVTRIEFHLEHSDTEKNLTIMNNGSWRLIQFQGYLAVPSFHQGLLKAHRPVEGQAKIAWGQVEQATSVEVELKSNNTAENWPANCENDSTSCLQHVSKFTTEQAVFLNCINLPIWLTTALLSIFPENVQADQTSTRINFLLPTKVPWASEGQCVITSNKILNFDNGTIQKYLQKTDCYAVAVADCSVNSTFVVGVTKSTNAPDLLELKMVSSYTSLIATSVKNNANRSLLINGTEFEVTPTYRFYPKESNLTTFLFQYKYWEMANMIEVVVGHSGLTLQYYGSSVVAIVEFKLRGKLCGLCGDFNGEMGEDDVTFTPCIKDFTL